MYSIINTCTHGTLIDKKNRKSANRVMQTYEEHISVVILIWSFLFHVLKILEESQATVSLYAVCMWCLVVGVSICLAAVGGILVNLYVLLALLLAKQVRTAH